MKLRKLAAFAAALVCVLALSAPAFAAAVVDLGAPNVENSDKQKGWLTDGVDGKTSPFSAADFTTATTLTLEFAEAPKGGMQLIWQGDGDSWTWNQTDGVISDDGTSETKLVIDLPSTLKNYDAFKKSTQIKIFLGYYTDGFDDLKITKATLTGGSDAPAAGGAANPDTGESVIVYVSAVMLLLASVSAFFFYRKTRED